MLVLLAGDSSRTGSAWVGLGSSAVILRGLFSDQLRGQSLVSPQSSLSVPLLSAVQEEPFPPCGPSGGTGSEMGTGSSLWGRRDRLPHKCQGLARLSSLPEAVWASEGSPETPPAGRGYWMWSLCSSPLQNGTHG